MFLAYRADGNLLNMSAIQIEKRALESLTFGGTKILKKGKKKKGID